jgi:hypothetical protein
VKVEIETQELFPYFKASPGNSTFVIHIN